MLAIEFSSPGPPDVLHAVNVPEPEIQPADVLIQVEAAGVSRADVLQRLGKYPPPPGASPILGLDVAGRIVKTGAAVKTWNRGDRVCALVSGGGYAELCAAPEPQVLPIPDGWSPVEAVTLPENLFTVYDNIVTRAQLKAGETVLIHGGTSGIGTTAIMLARALEAIPIVTAGTEEKCEAARRIGAEAAIDYRARDFVDAIRELTGGRGADMVVDIVGGAYLERNIDALATEGRLVLIATLGGAEGTLSISKLMQKRGTIFGSTLRARTISEKGAIAARLREHIWPMLPEKRSIRPVIDAVFNLSEARKAHERMERGDHVGKIVLTTSRT
jgi:putative PIG3 family NAD(P)H quinone oxidoreductase